MAVSKTFNGSTYSIAETGDSSWGDEISSFLQAVADHTLQKTAGTFLITADINFGDASSSIYGLKSNHYTSRTASAASAGTIRLANNSDSIAWRNAANSANLALKVNASNILEFNGNPIVTLALGSADTALKMNSGGTAYEYGKIANANVDAAAAIAHTKLAAMTAGYILLGNSSTVPTATAVSGDVTISDSGVTAIASGVIVNADIATAAAIAYSKLAALTISRALVSDGSGVVSVATTTATEIGYVNGVTSAIQTQLNAKAATGANSDITSLSALSTPLSIAQGGTSGATAAAAFDALAPTTTKGDLVAYSTTNARLAVGTDGQVLTANSAEATGLGWTSPLTNPMTTAGDIIIGGASGAATRLALGADNYILRSDGATLAWESGAATAAVSGLVKLPAGEVRVEVGNGHGSTNTKIRRFTTTVINTGSSITYADSATLGGTFTVSEAGIYAITFSDFRTAGTAVIGISVNSNQLTTSLGSITNTHRMAISKSNTAIPDMVTATVRLAASDVVRAHTDGATDSTDVGCAFHITQIAKL